MRVSHKIMGLEKLNKKLLRFKQEVMAGQIRAVQDATFLIHETAVGLVQDNTSGVPQVRYSGAGRKRVVLASRPGDPPNTDTGRLVQSIKFDFKNGGLIGRVGTNLRYGAFLEFGTRTMEARPWLSRAVKETSKVIADIFAKALERSTKEVDK